MAGSRRTGSRRTTHERRLARVVARVLVWERARRARVDVTLVSGAAMRRLNRRATGHRGLTDVISFALPQPDGTLLGDVYICPEVARRFAGPGVHEELTRLAVHGTLHVLGYDHPAGAGRMRCGMWLRQERYVRRLRTGGR